MNVFYQYIGEPGTFTTLANLLQHKHFAHPSRRWHLDDLKDSLAGKGWYENYDDSGHYLVLNIDMLSLAPK
jgi:hypothetical protein